MQKIGKYYDRETYYLELKKGYENHLPNGNWICFAIANEKPERDKLEKFIRDSIKNDLFEFKGQGEFGEYLHDCFDEEMVAMEVMENHSEIEIMTTGNNKDDLANSFWECFGATCLPERTNYDELKVICVSFDQIDYSIYLMYQELPNSRARTRIWHYKSLSNGLLSYEAQQQLAKFDLLEKLRTS